MSAWVQHVRQFAEDNGIKYGEAMSHPDCKESYHASKSQDGAGIGKAFKKVGKKLTDTKKMKYGKNVMKVMDFQNKMSQKIAGATKGIPGVNRVTGAIAMGNDKLTGFAHDVHDSRKQGGSDGKIFKRALGRNVNREAKEFIKDEIDDLMSQEQEGSGMYKALSRVKHAFKNTAKKGVKEVKSQGKQVARKASNDAKDWVQGQGKKMAQKAVGQVKDFARKEGNQALKAVKNEGKDIYQKEGKQAIGFAKQKARATYKQLKDSAIGEYRNKAGDAREMLQPHKSKQ